MLRSSGNVGKYIGGYHITLELASSLSSRVFLGESVSPDRHNAAIKRLYAILIASKQEQESFLNEARLLKQLDHPHILPLLSVDIIKGTPYVVSEYAPNGSLYERLQRLAPDPLTQHDALTILSQVGQGLQYAHQKNRVHGNLKPQNILFNGNGDALLADFKLASLSSLVSDFAAASPSPAFSYMSPEQIEGINSKENDQYSLGCIAYEMFTGRKPFTTPSLKQPGAYYKTRALIAPGKLNPALPQSIEQAILKAMAKESSQRYGSILEFIKALGTPGIATVPNAPPLLSETAGSRPTFASRQRQSLWGKPLFPGLKIANTGAMTLAQFTNRAALFRNTFSSLTSLPSLSLPNSKFAYPLPSHGKRNIRQSLLVMASLLLITAIAAAMIFAFSPSRMTQRNNTGTTSSITKTMAPQPHLTPSAIATHPTTKNRSVIVPIQPTQPPVHHSPTPTPAPKPSPVVHTTPQPTTAPRPTTTLSVAPVSLNSTNCTPGNGFYTCFVALSLGAGAANSQNWYTYTIGVGANFNPSNGSIAPGQTINIKLTIFDTCTKAGTFVFVGSKTNVTAAWNC
jgi:serine/threonine protein kinase